MTALERTIAVVGTATRHAAQGGALDPDAFGLTAAAELSPVRRVLLELAHTAVEDAGLVPPVLAGVFVAGGDHAEAVARVLGLSGPRGDCAGSPLREAVDSLMRHDCDIALAAEARPSDAAADAWTGAAAVLKPLDRALADGDPIVLLVEDDRGLADLLAMGHPAVSLPMPSPPAGFRPDKPRLCVVSARTPEALRAAVTDLRAHLDRDDAPELPDLAWSLATTRAAHPHRAAAVAENREELAATLDSFLAGQPVENVTSGVAGHGKVAFVFPGAGAQWVRMTADLIDGFPAYREHLYACEEEIRALAGYSVVDVLRGRPGAPDFSSAEVVHPALFAVMTSLAALWRSWGVHPDGLLGQCIGEASAAYVAGGLSLADAARVVVTCGGCHDTLKGGGGMVVVSHPFAEVERRLEPWSHSLDLAAVNGPNLIAVTGDTTALDGFTAELTRDGIRAQPIALDYTGHSRHSALFRDQFEAGCAPITPRAAALPFWSSYAGGEQDTAEADNAYWYRVVRHVVRFDRTVQAMLARGYRTFVDMGPHPALVLGLNQIFEANGVEATTIAALRRGPGGPRHALQALGRAQVAGATPDWTAVFAGAGARKVRLPTYPYQRRTPSEAAPAGGLAGMDTAARRTALQEAVSGALLAILGRTTSRADAARTFKDLGIDSLAAIEVRNQLRALTGLSLPATLVFDQPTPDALVRHLDERLSGVTAATAAVRRGPASDDPVAIVGMACRLPGGIDTPQQLWELLDAGAERVGDFPADRGWDLAGLSRRSNALTGSFLENPGDFDAEFFGIGPREALAMDPQQRLLLEVAWETLENAGIPPDALASTDTGVYVGLMREDYGPRLHEAPDQVSGYALTGSLASVASGRIAYAYGLDGPALTVDTACSSSLVAVHLAAQALRQGECSLALAGGATVMATPGLFQEFTRQEGLAPDGRCKSFGAGADGTAFGEGAGLVLLERLSDARRNGHRVLAVVAGSAMNQDGASNGLTAPNGPAQQRVIRQALANAVLGPNDVDAVEAHGTGTVLGDPIEAEALLAAYGQDRERPLRLGSLKSNIGHTQAAAGVAGVIKMVLALQHSVLPATLHAEHPSPHVDWESGQVRLLHESQPWPSSPDRPRRAGVSSFGISGTNAHVILQEAPAAEPPSAPAEVVGPVPIVLSARSAEALAESGRRLAALPGFDRAAVARSLAVTRAALPHRAAVVAEDDSQAKSALSDISAGLAMSAPRVGWLFTGQGSQWPGMAADLARAYSTFAATVERLCASFGPAIRELLLGDSGGAMDTSVAQPAIFVFQVALAGLLRELGVPVDVVVGHSVGEITAAVIAGVLSEDDGCRLVAARGRLMQDLPAGGAMATVQASPDELDLPDGVWIAGVNAPRSTVVSGDAAVLAGWEVASRPLHVAHAFHSGLMDPILPALAEVVEGLSWQPPSVPMVPAARVDAGVDEPAYWVAQAREAVHFADAVSRLEADVLVEVGPANVLAVLAGLNREDTTNIALVDRSDPVAALLKGLGQAWVAGVPVDWTALTPDVPTVELPTYAFQRQRYWLPTPRSDSAFWDLVDRGELGAALGLDDAPWLADLTSALSAWRAGHEAPAGFLRAAWEAADLPPAEPAGAWHLVHPDGMPADDPLLTCARAALAGLLVTETTAFALTPDPGAQILSLVDTAGTLTVAQKAIAAGARLWCVTRSALTDPESAGVWGLARVVALEHPEVGVVLVDLTPDSDAGPLRRVLAAAGEETELAIRPAGTFVRRLVPGMLPAGDESQGSWDTVLITGGTGGLGARVARWAVTRGARHLVIAGRSGPDAPGADRLATELRDLGASDARIVACDVSDRQAVATLLDDLPRLDAMLHLAGVTADGVVADLTPDRLAEAIGPKADGAWHLHDLTRDRDLTAFVMFSSVSGALGMPGQGAYAAANARLDALAEHRRALGLPGVSIAWGPWAGDGMAADPVARRQLRMRGLRPMAAPYALAALGRAITAGESTPVIADADWARFATARPGHVLDGLRGPEDTTEALDDRPPAELVRAHAAAVLGHADPGRIDPARSFRDLGFDSLAALELRNRLSAALGRALPATLVFDYPTVAALGRHLKGDAPPAAVEPPRVVDAAEPIAIVALACRLPGDSGTPEDFWRLLSDGADAIVDVPADRGWDLSDVTGGFLDDAAGFDAAFFGISPREALAIDPQQRILLELAWETLERAGIDSATLAGGDTGVFVGSNGQDYAMLAAAAPEQVAGYFGTGSSASVLSGRVAYTLGLEGPAVTVDTACSSSLVAIHLAARSLRSGECSLALVGGVTVMATPAAFVDFRRQGGLAADGRCKSFGAGADGTGWGEGAGVLLLERLSDARRNGHRVLATVAGSAVNQDGASNGLTAPNGPAQQRVIRQALANAGLDPSEVDAVEAHGTGTVLGDPIEAQALLEAYGRDRDRPLWLGSVKSNIGHTQAAAGIAGVIKMVLAMQHEMLPATLHADVPSPHIEWDAGPVRLLQRAQPWPPSADRPRRAGVSSFGISGTNAHVILQEAPEPLRIERKAFSGPVPLVVSARDGAALHEYGRRLARTDVELPTLSRSLATTRAAMPHRAVVVATDRSEALAALAELTGTKAHTPRVGWLFTGQGSQWSGMAAGLAEAFPAFGVTVERLCAAFDPAVRELLLGPNGQPEDTSVAQPALFVFQLALAGLLRDLGVPVDVVAGHSVGEIAAAVIAGVLSEEDAGQLVAARGRLMQDLPAGGAMAAVQVAADELDLPDGLWIAGVNAPRSTVVSGDAEILDKWCVQLDVRTRRLHVAHAFHSGLMDPILPALADVLGTLDWQTPAIPMVPGARAEIGLDDPAYWVAQAREPVLFADAVTKMDADLLLEIGPDAVLTVLAGLNRDDTTNITLVRRGQDPATGLLRALGEVWTAGAPVDWAALTPDVPVAELPTHPFQHQRFWMESGPSPMQSLRAEWRPFPLSAPGSGHGRWLAFGEDLGLPQADLLDISRGDRVLCVAEDVTSTVELIQAVVAAEARLWLVTRGVASAVNPWAAQIWGLGLSASLEHPAAVSAIVDMPMDGWDDDTVRLLWQICEADTVEDQFSIREGEVFVRRVVPTDLPTEAWRVNGTVLVTGGTGGLGGHVARWLRANGAGRVVLASRSGRPAPDLDAEVVACDVTDRDALAALLAEVGPLSAVVHAAGVSQTQPFAETTAGDVERVLAGKVWGARWLHELLPPETIFVAFSSIAGVWGSGGQAVYAAGNAYLDALMEHRRALGLPGVSVAWGPWAGDGMASVGEARAAVERRGLRSLEPRRALGMLARALSGGPAVALTDVDWARFLPAYTAARPRPLFDDLPAAQPAETPSAPRTDLAPDSLADLVRTHTAAVLGHADAASLPTDQPFKELGFDSLTAVELRNRLAADTGLTLPVAIVYDHPNAGRLADHLTGLLFGADEERRTRELLASLPLDRLREAGLLDRLLELAGERRPPAAEAAPVGDELDEMSAENLITMALRSARNP